MGLNRGQIKTNVRINLDDAGVTFWSDLDFNDSIQDAYDDIACLSQCIVKIVDNISFIANRVYYDPVNDLGLTDWLQTIAVFNKNTNFWLRDDISLRDLDRFRYDWEVWNGTPQFWTPTDPHRFAMAPNYGSSPFGSFKLVYWATAPSLTDDSSTFLIADDVNNLLEFYVTADMLEQAQEFTKAQEYWGKYIDSLVEYSQRVKTINSSGLLIRI